MSERLEALLDASLAENAEKGNRCFWWDGKWYTASDFLSLAHSNPSSNHVFAIVRKAARPVNAKQSTERKLVFK